MSKAKYATIAFDSASELARLHFSEAMGKHGKDTNKIRAMNDYPRTTEKLNMFIRRMKDFRKAGAEIVFTAHEDLQKVYAKGGAMAPKGQPPPEPIAVKGWPDMPGNRTPDEMCRAADNVLRVRYVNGKAVWIANREPIGGGGNNWEVKDRFNAPAITAGILPPSYSEVARLAKANPLCNWSPPYIWIEYGSFGIGKTRSLLTFPRPIIIFDLDGGTKSIEKEVKEARAKGEIFDIVDDLNPEEGDDLERFTLKVEACLE